MKLISKKEAGLRHVYDIEVDQVHNFYADGVNVHNCATAGGVSVIKHNGTVVNSSDTSGYVSININSKILTGAQTAGNYGTRYVLNPGGLNASFAMSSFSSDPDFKYGSAYKILGTSRTDYIRRLINSSTTQRLRLNESNTAGSIANNISQYYNSGLLLGSIRRSYLCDSIVQTLSEQSLVTGNNSTFDASIGDWTAWGSPSSPTVAWDASSAMSITASGAIWQFAVLSLPTEPNSTYEVSFTIKSATSAAVQLMYNTGINATSTLRGAVNTGGQLISGLGAGTYKGKIFTEASTTYLMIGPYNQAAGWSCLIDDVTVVRCDPDRVVSKNGTAYPYGTLTKSQVATGTSLVAYSGFSAANYLREPYSADLDFGTGEWSVGAWVNYRDLIYSNRLANPENLGAAPWTAVNGTLTQDGTIAPTGVQAWKYVVDASGTSTVHQFRTTNNNDVNIAYDTQALSVYIKPSGITKVRFGFAPDGLQDRAMANIDFVSKTIIKQGGGTEYLAGYLDELEDGWFRVTVIVTKSNSNGGYIGVYALDSAGNSSFIGDGVSGFYLTGFQLSQNCKVRNVYTSGKTAAYFPPYAIAAREFSLGPYTRLQDAGDGKLTATAYDGTTTRTVTTTAAYNTATWLKAEAIYKTDGSLAILVNGNEVAVTRGNPLLTLNNSNAVLTIGNSYALDAPFPGSIALLKLSATAPTYDQALWMYEQEKHLFRSGAQCVLPDSGSIVDLSYDDVTDKWIAVSATNESEWTGLVRTKVTAVPAGSYSKVSAGSGIKLEARTTTSPGVDVTIPAYGLREELLKDAEDSGKLARIPVALDYVGGFTATTVTGNTAITAVSGLSYPSQTTIIGATVTGSGIPASTTVVGISGTTIYLSKAATASASNVQISFTDFVLPLGYEAKDVLLAGVSQKEGATAAFTRLFDGFRETIRFGTTPAYNALVQIQAIRSQT